MGEYCWLSSCSKYPRHCSDFCTHLVPLHSLTPMITVIASTDTSKTKASWDQIAWKCFHLQSFWCTIYTIYFNQGGGKHVYWRVSFWVCNLTQWANYMELCILRSNSIYVMGLIHILVLHKTIQVKAYVIHRIRHLH